MMLWARLPGEWQADQPGPPGYLRSGWGWARDQGVRLDPAVLVPRHVSQIFPAGSIVDQVDDEGPHDRTPLFDRGSLLPGLYFGATSRASRNGFVSRANGFEAGQASGPASRVKRAKAPPWGKRGLLKGSGDRGGSSASVIKHAKPEKVQTTTPLKRNMIAWRRRALH